MRIVAGEFRGRALQGPPEGAPLRPTSDRLRETLFDILHHRFDLPREDTRVLDLFAGTGALGLEAVSRGAAHALFVETGVAARSLIRQNVEALGLTGRTRLFRRDATDLGRAGTIPPFDLLLADPPYGEDLGPPALHSAATGGWLADGAMAVLEERADARLDLGPPFRLVEQRRVGDSQLMFLALGA